MITRTENDFKNFNDFIRRLRECKVDLNCFTGQEDRFGAEIQKLNLLIRNYEYKLKIIKCSLGVLCDIDLLVITDYYFAKTPINNISIKLNVSSATVFKHKKRAIKELAEIMYGHWIDSDYICFETIQYDNKRKNKPIYQYDLQSKFINKWNSVKECEENGFLRNDIYKCCIGKLNLYKGYRWSRKPLVVGGECITKNKIVF